MAGGIDSTFGTQILAATAINSSTATIGTRTVTAPMKLALITTTTPSTDTANGSEVSGGSYARQSITFGTAASLSVTTTAAVTYTSMPAVTLYGVEEWDSASTPLRYYWAPFTSEPITVASGNTFTVASGSLTNTLA